MSEPASRLSEKEARRNPLVINDMRRRVLDLLRQTRFALTQHFVVTLGISRSNLSRLLGPLYRHHYLDRMPQLVRHGPGAPALVYTLGILGQEYIAELHGVPPEDRHRRPARPISAYFVEHYLAIADIYVALQAAAREHGLTLLWSNEVEARRPFQSRAEDRVLAPDGILWLGGPKLLTTLVLLEVDRSTESLQRWQGKLRDYQDYFTAPGGFAAQYERPPRVLVLVTTRSAERARSLRSHTARVWQQQWAGYPFRMGFAVHDPLLLNPVGILALPWTGLDGKLFRLVE